MNLLQYYLQDLKMRNEYFLGVRDEQGKRLKFCNEKKS